MKLFLETDDGKTVAYLEPCEVKFLQQRHKILKALEENTALQKHIDGLVNAWNAIEDFDLDDFRDEDKKKNVTKKAPKKKTPKRSPAKEKEPPVPKDPGSPIVKPVGLWKRVRDVLRAGTSPMSSQVISEKLGVKGSAVSTAVCQQNIAKPGTFNVVMKGVYELGDRSDAE